MTKRNIIVCVCTEILKDAATDTFGTLKQICVKVSCGYEVHICITFIVWIFLDSTNCLKHLCPYFESYFVMFNKIANRFIECMSGHTGENCTLKCTYPSYGVRCQELCKCDERYCSATTGCIEPISGKAFSFRMLIL